MFFTWVPDHHLTEVSLLLQPLTRSSRLLGGLPAVPHFDPRPGALVLGSQSLDLGLLSGASHYACDEGELTAREEPD
ncbi:Lysozyme C [Dissostichus eleginoides]|uniref:Lysozyme C n=1 Tax=Dissostichus eleginoides TaxID=100907 RepID=A0AAD9CL59_DISEL|nr:Lysozyme C [Dissostichus eleginoides]